MGDALPGVDPSQKGNLGKLTELSGGDAHVCVRYSLGAVRCWGQGGAAKDPETQTNGRPGEPNGSVVGSHAHALRPVRRVPVSTSLSVRLSPWLLVGLGLIGLGCRREASFDEAKVTKSAQARLAPFKKSLKEALVAALGKGLNDAVDTCASEAPRLALAHSTADIKLGRSAIKFRNQDNAPRAWVQKAMAELAIAPKDGASRVVKLEGDRVGYVETIVAQPMCLTCHGKNLPGDLTAKLKQRYPDDQATGFEAGDFRGVFWLEMPVSQSESP
jgi:hypothetical protein